MIEINNEAPSFSLPGDDGKTHRLEDFRGKYLVLYFYPRDDTPGCTTEAKGFSSRISEIRKLGAEIVGISNDDVDSHCRFRDKYGLGVLLLSDIKSDVIKVYDAYGNKGILGFGTLRKTYIIDKSGKIAKIFEKVNPNGHENEIVDFLKQAGS